MVGSGIRVGSLISTVGRVRRPSTVEVMLFSLFGVAQAQLVGWLEGLFHGIQAAMFAQQAAARQQFEELRRRGLPGQDQGMQGPDGAPQDGSVRGGQYL